MPVALLLGKVCVCAHALSQPSSDLTLNAKPEATLSQPCSNCLSNVSTVHIPGPLPLRAPRVPERLDPLCNVARAMLVPHSRASVCGAPWSQMTRGQRWPSGIRCVRTSGTSTCPRGSVAQRIRRSGRSGHCVCSASTTSHNDWLLSPPPSSPFPHTEGWLALTPNATS